MGTSCKMPWADARNRQHNGSRPARAFCVGLEFLLGDRVALTRAHRSPHTVFLACQTHESEPSSKANNEVAEGFHRHSFQLKANLAGNFLNTAWLQLLVLRLSFAAGAPALGIGV